MALPTKIDIEGLDIVFLGRPYVFLGAKSDLDTSGGTTFMGRPWYGVVPSGSTTQSLSVVPSGGAIVGGSAPIVFLRTSIAIGGAVSGGSPFITRSLAKLMAGGALAGGAAIPCRGVVKPVSGGAIIGGAPTITRGLSKTMTGGGVSAGSAIIALSGLQLLAMIASGGAIAGGSAINQVSKSLTMAGGGIGGGESYVRLTSASSGGEFTPGLYRMIQMGDGIVYLAKIGG